MLHYKLLTYLDKIIQNASSKKAILFTTLFITFFVTINFSPIGFAGLQQIVDGARILDFEFGFTYEVAQEILTALGDEGRAFYLRSLILLDTPFPITVMLALVSYISLLLKHTSVKKMIRYLLIIPVLFMLFDYIENIGIIIMLINHPNLPRWAVMMSSISGMLKYISSAVSVVAVVALFVVFLRSKFNRKSNCSNAVDKNNEKR